MKNKSVKKHLLMFITVLYVSMVLWVTLIDREFGVRRSMLTPFWKYSKVIHNERRHYFIWQILGNIALFVPMLALLAVWSTFAGTLLPLKKMKEMTGKNKAVLTIAIGMSFSIFIEVTQYVTGRGLMEFDDVFNNTVGTAIGVAVVIMFHRVNNRRLGR